MQVQFAQRFMFFPVTIRLKGVMTGICAGCLSSGVRGTRDTFLLRGSITLS